MAVTQSLPRPVGPLDSPRPASARRLDWRTAILCIPELIAVGVAGFSVLPMVLLLAGQFHPGLAIALGLLGAVAAIVASGLLVSDQPPPLRPGLPGQRPVTGLVLTVLAVVLAFVWLAFNLRYYAEDVYAQRDPATYSLAARWLMSHASLAIPTHPELFGSPTGYDDTSAGFAHITDGTVHAQGNHLLPVLLACLGSVFGTTAMLQGNMVLGALGLITFYGVARQVVGHGFAFVAVAALAVSMPFLYVTRDTYSEPLALLLTMGGLSLLYRALRTGRSRDYATAGFVTGATALVRIDGYVTLLSLLVVATVVVGLARGGPGWRRGAALLVPAAVLTLLGWLDVSRLSPSYYHNQHHQISSIFKAAIVLAVLGVVVAILLMRPAVRRVVSSLGRARPVSVMLGLAVVGAFALLASRPHWMQTHGLDNTVVSTTQRLALLPVDGTRTYNEQTLNWQAMYFGWPVIALAVVGYVLLIIRLVRRRELALLAILTVGLSMSALYLWSSEITPDQVWAMRRYVPVVLPILFIAAAYVLAVVWHVLALRWRQHGLARPAVWCARAALVLVGLTLVWKPWTVTHPVFTLREEVPQLGQVNRICAALPADAAVLIVDDGLRWGYGQTIRTYCDVPVLSLVGADSTALAGVRSSVTASGRTLYVVAAKYEELTFTGAIPEQPFSSVETTRWPSVIGTVPKGPAVQTVGVYLATVRADGQVDEVSR
jgi:hypothetical protein